MSSVVSHLFLKVPRSDRWQPARGFATGQGAGRTPSDLLSRVLGTLRAVQCRARSPAVSRPVVRLNGSTRDIARGLDRLSHSCLLAAPFGFEVEHRLRWVEVVPLVAGDSELSDQGEQILGLDALGDDGQAEIGA